MTELQPRDDLIALRGLAGLKQSELAEKIGASVDAVSNWERGKTVPRPKFRQPLANALGISLTNLEGLFGNVVTLGLAGHTIQPWLTHYDSLIVTAGTIHQVALRYVPGQLQTWDYATTVEQSVPGSTPEQITQRVDDRLDRQKVLHRVSSPPKLLAVLHETVLLQRTDAMAGQLDYLVEISDARKNVDIRLLAADGRDFCVASSFELLTKPNETVPFMAITFDETGANYHEGVRLGPFLEMWAHLTSIIMPPDKSLERIREIRDSLG